MPPTRSAMMVGENISVRRGGDAASRMERSRTHVRRRHRRRTACSASSPSVDVDVVTHRGRRPSVQFRSQRATPPVPGASPSWSCSRAPPCAAQIRRWQTGDQRRVLHRDARLVIVAVERPGLQLTRRRRRPSMQQPVERVLRCDTALPPIGVAARLPVPRATAYAPAINGPVIRRSPCRRCATAHPAASALGALGRTVEQDRVGVVDVDQNLLPHAEPGERTPWRRRVRRRSCGPCAGRSCAEPGADHLVIGPQRAVEQHRVGAL